MQIRTLNDADHALHRHPEWRSTPGRTDGTRATVRLAAGPDPVTFRACLDRCRGPGRCGRSSGSGRSSEPVTGFVGQLSDRAVIPDDVHGSGIASLTVGDSIADYNRMVMLETANASITRRKGCRYPARIYTVMLP
jgi:hypothetical protein